MIIASGFNTYPSEVESILMRHDGITEAAVIGFNNDVGGEVVKASIVKNDNNLTAKDIATYCKQNLTRYKCPKIIEFFDKLPKSNVGKILHNNLR